MTARSTIQLTASDPVSLQAIAGSHGWTQLLPLRWDEEAAVLHSTQLVAEGVVEVSFSQPSDRVIAMDTASGAELAVSSLSELVRRARWMLALDEDLTDFFELVQAEPRLKHVLAEGKGRFLRSPTVFEDAVKCICTTNTTWAQTKGMVQRLVERLGAPSPVSGRHAFPTPRAVSEAGQSVLENDVRLGYRAPYVHELAKRCSSGELALEALRTLDLPTAELRAQLLGIKGVGPYAAASLLMLIGRYDYIGVDSWARKLVSQHFHGGQPVGEKQIQAAFERFGRWKALAYWFYRFDAM